MSCEEPEQESAACDGVTPIEVQLKDALAQGCVPVPSGGECQVSP